MTHVRTILGCFLCAIAAAAPAYAQDDAMNSVKGLPGVALVIEGLPDRSQNPEVITKEMVQADVEAQLRAAGIRVLTPAEVLRHPSKPSLVVNVAATHVPGDTYASMVLVSVRQWATLNSGQGLIVTTWQDGGAGWATAATRVERERTLIGETVAHFVNLWKFVNASK